MTKEQTKEAIRIMQAFVDGKEVVARHVNFGTWDTLISPKWSWEDCEYRIKPTPVLRPWTADEVPLGAWLRDKSDKAGRRLLICAYEEEHRIHWLNHHEHSTDCGKTWLPCGVMEEAK
jgi:hypothetical protein